MCDGRNTRPIIADDSSDPDNDRDPSGDPPKGGRPGEQIRPDGEKDNKAHPIVYPVYRRIKYANGYENGTYLANQSKIEDF